MSALIRMDGLAQAVDSSADPTALIILNLDLWVRLEEIAETEEMVKQEDQSYRPYPLFHKILWHSLN